jgi:hypothetical protein
MPISIPITITMSDEAITTIAAALGLTPSKPAASAPGVGIELPGTWTHVEDLPDQSYGWPNKAEPEHYNPFSVYTGATSAGSVRIAVGHCEREAVWGSDRPYLITFYMSPGGAKRPLCEFLRDDEGGYVSVIKGKGENGRSLYGAGDKLTGEYGGLDVAMYPDRVHAKGVWRKKVVVASGADDIGTILNHSLIQAGLRFGLMPS